ncbi:MAG: hypothetical protein KDB14_24060 [Planctomycetales bacterium]|nr:hypothetical protein [Planctomycetales bacterium]
MLCIQPQGPHSRHGGGQQASGPHFFPQEPLQPTSPQAEQLTDESEMPVQLPEAQLEQPAPAQLLQLLLSSFKLLAAVVAATGMIPTPLGPAAVAERMAPPPTGDGSDMAPLAP